MQNALKMANKWLTKLLTMFKVYTLGKAKIYINDVIKNHVNKLNCFIKFVKITSSETMSS